MPCRALGEASGMPPRTMAVTNMCCTFLCVLDRSRTTVFLRGLLRGGISVELPDSAMRFGNLEAAIVERSVSADNDRILVYRGTDGPSLGPPEALQKSSVWRQ